MLNRVRLLVECSVLCQMRYEMRAARGVTDDTARTAREITAMVADYYAKNGGQLSGSGIKPKIIGNQ
jgi:hypothetical protein